MTLIKVMTTVVLASMLAGCATMKRTAYFEPVKEGTGWTQVINGKGVLEFGEIPPDVAYKCGDTSITFQSTKLKEVGTIGPPLIPFPFPLIDDRSKDNAAPVDFKYESPGNKTRIVSAVILVNDNKIEPFEKLAFETAVNSSSSFRYSYRINWQKVESLLFQLETSDPACGVISIPYNKEYHMTYSMF